MKQLIGFFIAILCVMCVDEDHFGTSDYAIILNIELSSQSGTAQIFNEKDSVFVEVANGTDLSKIILKKLEISPFATASVDVENTLDFSQGNQFVNITSESGLTRTWQIQVYEVGSEPQIENSDFNIWYDQGSYLDLGLDDASSSWATSNPGVIFGGMAPNVERIEVGEDDYAAKLITRFTFMGSLVRKPIAAGSVFVGDFMEDEINIGDPQAALNMGIPFTATPTSFSVEYQYSPGEKNIDANQNELDFSDTGDIYVLLERREADEVKRVATAWYRIEEKSSVMENTMVNFIYGELPSGTPTYILPQDDETYATEGESPTHIKVVFSSSAYGDLFQGAEGSTLIIDNFKLIY